MPATLTRRYAARVAAFSDPSLKDVLAQFPGVITFGGGLPDAHTFPVEQLQEVAGKVAAQRQTWQYSAAEGWLPLREKLADHMQQLGMQVTAENILLTSGSQHALDLICKTLLDPGDDVLMETPGYLGARQAALSYEANIDPVPIDEDGLIADAMSPRAIRDAKFVYTVSTFQNPTGVTISPERRRQIARLITANDGLLLEDVAYYWLSYDGNPPRPIAADMDPNHVIFMGSFSKVLVPGLRVAWIVAPKPLIEQLALVKSASDLATNTYGQVFIHTWLTEYGLAPDVNWYRTKRDKALQALTAHMPEGVAWNKPGGGFFIWITVPDALDTRQLLPDARANGVTYVPGSAFGGAPNTLRFSYSETPLEHIDEGVQRLARTFSQALHKR